MLHFGLRGEISKRGQGLLNSEQASVKNESLCGPSNLGIWFFRPQFIQIITTQQVLWPADVYWIEDRA